MSKNLVYNPKILDTEDEYMVSIVCITYNHEQYIRKALDSFLMQKTKFKFEVIVHDDASTDKTTDIIREYAEKYPDIIHPIIQKDNQYSKGICVFSEYIYPSCKGRYIAWCEGDDYWTYENKLQTQVEFLESHQDYSACAHQVIIDDLRKKKQSVMNEISVDCDLSIEGMISWYRGNEKIHINSLLARSIYIKKRPNSLRRKWISGDWIMCIYLSSVGRLHFFSQPMSIYNSGVPDSWTVKNESANKSFLNMWRFNIKIVDMIMAVDKDLNYKYHDMFKVQYKEYLIKDPMRWMKCSFLNIVQNILGKQLYEKIKNKYKHKHNQNQL